MVVLSFVSAHAEPLDSRAQTALDWINGIHTLKARFSQVGPDGMALHGTFYLKRPGRLRFAYDPPVADFVVADGHFIYFWNAELQQQSNAPIGSTIADLLLRAKIEPGEDMAVTDVREGTDGLRLSLASAKEPEQGSLTLVFAEDPFRLVRWEVLDALGQVTHVFLDSVETDVPLDADLFYFIDPTRKLGELNR